MSALLSVITTPIPGDNPCGTNINYDTDFDIVKNEIAKLTGIDYDLLDKTSIKILKEKSKDIRIFSFLSFSYLKEAKWEEFSDVFDGLGTLVEAHYDALFPDRDRAKQLAFKWLGEERFNLLLEEKKPVEADYDHITRLLAGLTKIKPVLEQKFPDGSPFPSVLFKFAQQWERSCKPKPKVEPPPPPPPPQAAAVSAPSISTGDAPPSTAPVSAPPQTAGAGVISEAMDTPKQAQGIIRKAAQFLAEKERDKIMGYRIMRSLRWDILDKAPPAEGGKIKLEGPNPQQRAYFQKLIADKEWKTLLEKGESAFTSGANHLWLDLQRFIATACKELGAEFASVSRAILVETALLVKRIPDLPALQFADGSACGDDATKDWITTEVLAALGSSSGAAGGSTSSDPLIEEQRAINKLVSANQIEDALSLVQNAMRASSNERDNFRRTVIISTLLLKAKQPDIAMSMLETLDLKIDTHRLDTWDPETAVEAWTALVMSYKVSKPQKPQNIQAIIQDKQTIILSKIARIDAGKSFTLSK